MSQPIKFHRLASGSTPSGSNYIAGHVYFIYNSDGTGVLKLCKTAGTASTAVLEDYTQAPNNGAFTVYQQTGSSKTTLGSTSANASSASSATVDAYTRSEIDSKVTTINNTIATKVAKAGDTMTGSLTFDNVNGIKLASDNADKSIWTVWDKASGEGSYGFRCQYNGTGSGDGNSLSLIADNQSSTEVNAMTMTQAGVITLNSRPKVGSTNVALTSDINDAPLNIKVNSTILKTFTANDADTINVNFTGSGAASVSGSGETVTISSTDQCVTAVGYHYTPSGGSSKSASGGTDTNITNLGSGNGVNVVTGVTVDAAGHVTGVSSKALRSVDTNTHNSHQVDFTDGTATDSTGASVAVVTTIPDTTSSTGTMTTTTTRVNVPTLAVTSGLASALDSKLSTSVISNSTLSTAYNTTLTSGRVLVTGSSGNMAVSKITNTELGYLDDCTGNVQDQLDSKLDESAIVTSMSSSSTDDQVPSAKCVYDTITDNEETIASALADKEPTSTAVRHTASTAVGSSTQPVYVASNGTATACDYTLGKSVPSTAVFTDSKVSSAQTTSKIYLTGTTSQSGSGLAGYSNSSCYAQSGSLYSQGKRVYTEYEYSHADVTGSYTALLQNYPKYATLYIEEGYNTLNINISSSGVSNCDNKVNYILIDNHDWEDDCTVCIGSSTGDDLIGTFDSSDDFSFTVPGGCYKEISYIVTGWGIIIKVSDKMIIADSGD